MNKHSALSVGFLLFVSINVVFYCGLSEAALVI